jgi:hypothetical protein
MAHIDSWFKPSLEKLGESGTPFHQKERKTCDLAPGLYKEGHI